MKNVHAFYDWIHLYVVVNDNNYIMSSQPEDVTGDFRKHNVDQMNWYQTLEGESGSYIYLDDFLPPVSTRQEHFAFAFKVRDIYSWHTSGYIIAVIDKQPLHNMLQGTNFEHDGLDRYIDSETYCSADLIAPDLYRQVIFEPQRRFYTALREMGLISVSYFLGVVNPLLSDLAQLGIDGLVVEEG